ncbi:MAG: hypothetical protein E6J82_04570 [Deltaproteobacteria bacterium]|nr:MAG: hypothetical protein E6J82_04570 [Deltaproteobacteria bacterium]
MSSEAELPQPTRAAPPALVALVAPDSGMERQAKVGKAGLAVAIAIACSLFAAFGHSMRVDAQSATLQKLDAAGQLASSASPGERWRRPSSFCSARSPWLSWCGSCGAR